MRSFVPPPGAYLVFELEPEATLELHCDVTDEAAVEELRKLSFKKYIGCTVKIIDDPPRPARNYNRVSISPLNWAMDNEDRPVLRPISLRVSTEIRDYGLTLQPDDETSVPRVSLDSEMTAFSESDEQTPLLGEPDREDSEEVQEKEHHSTSTIASTIFKRPSMVITLIARDPPPEEDLEFTPIVRIFSEYTTDLARDSTELYEEYTALQRIVEAANQRRREASTRFAKEHGMFEDVPGCGCFDFQLNPCSLLEKLRKMSRDWRTKMRSPSALGDVNEKRGKKKTIWKLVRTRLKPRVKVAS